MSIAGIALGFTYIFRRFTKNRFGTSYISLIFISTILSYLIVLNTNANRLAFSSPVKSISLFTYTQLKKIYSGERLYVSEDSKPNNEIDHIIWIIDESVRGDHFNLNGYENETTPFLSSLDSNILNLGVGSSASVCSDYSHISLYGGLRMQVIPDIDCKSRKSCSIFQYAKKAGYTPALIYSPGYEDVPKSYFTLFDFEIIKSRYQSRMLNPKAPAYLLDFLSIDYLLEIINTNSKSFTYFLKYGSHFHYESSYPKDHKFFRPTQAVGQWKRSDKTLLINSYDNSLRWSVDEFFKTFLPKLKDKKYLIIYTSDHGQNLLDYPEITVTHCSKKIAPKEMATVPFLIFGNQNTLSILKQKINPSIVPSHFNIFPTTIELTGYDSTFIDSSFDPSFTTLSPDIKPVYFSGDIFGRSKCYQHDF